jgi:lycopene cyclase domain-containing protein
MDRYQYLLLLGACAVGTVPLELVFRAHVYRQPLRLLRALWLPVLTFCVWDAVAIARGHWTFSERYTTGWRLPFDIPVEELAFFVVIPTCALLTLESVRHVLRSEAETASARSRPDDDA